MNNDTTAEKAICNALAQDAGDLVKSVMDAHAQFPDGDFGKFLSDYGATLSALKMQAQDFSRRLTEEATFTAQFAK